MAAAGSPLGPTNFPPCYLTAQTGNGVLDARSIALPNGDEKRANSDPKFEAIGHVAGRSLLDRRTSHGNFSTPSAALVKAMQPVSIERPSTAHPTGSSPTLQLGSLSRTASFGNGFRSASTPHAAADVKKTLEKLAQLRGDHTAPLRGYVSSEFPPFETIIEDNSPPLTTSRTLANRSGVVSPLSGSDDCVNGALSRIAQRYTDSPLGSNASEDVGGRISKIPLVLQQPDSAADLSPDSLSDELLSPPFSNQRKVTSDEFQAVLSQVIEKQEEARNEATDLREMISTFLEKKASPRLRLAQYNLENVPEIEKMFRDNLDLFSQVKDCLPPKIAAGGERIDLRCADQILTQREIQDFIEKHGPGTALERVEEVSDLGGMPRSGSERRLPTGDYKLTGNETVAEVLDKYPVIQRQYAGERLDKEKPRSLNS